MTTNLLSLQKKRSFMSALSVMAFLLLTVSVFGQAVSSVSPSTITNRTRVSLVGTGFTSTGTVKLGASSASAVSATYTYIDATHAQIIPGATTPDGTLNIYFGSNTTSSGTLTKLTPSPTPANAKIDRLITDFGGYRSTTSATTNPAEMTNTRHNLTAFRYDTRIYSTGVADNVLNTQLGSGNFAPGDFRALPLNEIIGNTVTSSSSTYIQLGSLIDGSASTADVTSAAVAGLKIRDVLIDGIKGLDIGTGVTNVGADVALVFPITSVTQERINDAEPDIVVSQIAQPGAAEDNDIYSFIDANGNIVGNPVQVSFAGVGAIGTNRVDLFKLTTASYSTAVPSAANSTNDTKDIRMVAFKVSDFGITTAAVANTIKGFKILPSGSSDPAFIAYNANTFVIPFPAIGTHPVSINKCGTTGSANFSVSASGMDLSYQWTKNGVNIAGATAATYSISTPVVGDEGEYAVVVSNMGGSVTSNSAFLTVTGSTSTTWNGGTSTDWNTASNWSCNLVPSATVSANIPKGTTFSPVLSAATGTTFNLNVASGAILTVALSGDLKIAGNIKKDGTLIAIDGTISMIGTTGAQAIPANTFSTNTIKNLTINNTNGVTLAGELNLTGVLAPTAGTFTTGNQLTLKSNATTTAVIGQVGGSVTGEMTIERYIPSKRAFRYITSTVDGGSIRANWQEDGIENVAGWGTDITGAGGATNGFDASGSNNASLFTYFNANTTAANSWNAVANTNTTNLVAGVPYRLMVRGDRMVNQFLNNSPSSVTTLRTKGTVKTGNIVVSNLTTNASRYVFVGNPYQAQVDMRAVLNASTGFNKTFYQIWDPTINDRGAYVTYNVVDSQKSNSVSAINQFAQPGQAFFLKTAAATQTLTFTEANKLVSNTPTYVYRSSDALATMKFNLYENATLATTGNSADGFIVVFKDASNNGIDDNDAIKITNLDENVGLLNSGKVLSYESRNFPTEADVIPLSQTQYRYTNYTYKVAVDGLENVSAYLLDKSTNTRTALENGTETSVPFTVNLTEAASIAADRFDVVFGTSLSTGETAFANAVSVYPNPITDNQFFVKLPTQESEAITVKLVNLLGQEVYSQKLNATEGILNIQPETALQSGIYLVNISNGSNTATKKLIVK